MVLVPGTIGSIFSSAGLFIVLYIGADAFSSFLMGLHNLLPCFNVYKSVVTLFLPPPSMQYSLFGKNDHGTNKRKVGPSIVTTSLCSVAVVEVGFRPLSTRLQSPLYFLCLVVIMPGLRLPFPYPFVYLVHRLSVLPWKILNIHTKKRII